MKRSVQPGFLLLLFFGRPAQAQQTTSETQNKVKLQKAGVRTLISSFQGFPHVVWLDDATLLRFIPLPQPPGTWPSFRMVKWDANSNREIPAGSLSAWFAETNGSPYSVQIAPDGRHLLWTGEKIGPNRPGRPKNIYFAVITDLDGRMKYECPIDDIGVILKPPARWYGGSFADSLRWMPDSKRWLEFVPANFQKKTLAVALVREIGNEKVMAALSVAPGVFGVPSLYDGNWIILSAMRGYRSNYDDTKTTRLSLRDGKFSLSGADAMYLAVDKAIYNYWSLSPDGSRILWVREDFTQEMKPRLGNEDQSFVEIWTANRHGKKKRRVLSIETTRDENRIHAIADAQWLPDGKRVSFLYNETLYILPDKAR